MADPFCDCRQGESSFLLLGFRSRIRRCVVASSTVRPTSMILGRLGNRSFILPDRAINILFSSWPYTGEVSRSVPATVTECVPERVEDNPAKRVVNAHEIQV